MLAPALTIGGLALATLALHLRDPHQDGSWGLCPSAAMGFYCPGCGGLRAVNDLTNGDVGAALSSNVVVTLLIPFAVVLLVIWAGRPLAGRTRGRSPGLAFDGGVSASCVLLSSSRVVRNTGPRRLVGALTPDAVSGP